MAGFFLFLFLKKAQKKSRDTFVQRDSYLLT